MNPWGEIPTRVRLKPVTRFERAPLIKRLAPRISSRPAVTSRADRPSGRLGEALAFVDRIGALATAEGIVSTARICGAMGAPAPNIGALFAEGFFLMPPDFAADPTSRLWSMPDDDLSSFNREDDPPTNVPLRILVDDDVKEYALPWSYEFRDGDFFAVQSGLALHESLAVRGWSLWRE